MTDWNSCATPPTRHDWYEVERRFKDGGQLHEPERIRWEDGWKVIRGEEILNHNVWREVQ